MPSFSSLFKRRKKKTTEQNNDTPHNLNQGAVAGNGTNENVQHRKSKRDFLRNLLRPSSTLSESPTNRRRSNQVKQDSKPTSPNKIVSPMPNSNKPLPAPPVSTIDEPAPPAKASIKLNRIISPLSLTEVHKLFSGAPQFFVRSEGRHTGPPRPSVAFPWDTEVHIRDLCDHAQIEDQAWGSMTTYPHITRDSDKDKDAIIEHKGKQRAHFITICHERPNMLSMQGLERGTVGFSAALEMGVADTLYEGTEEPPSPGKGSLIERRNHFLMDKKHGVRPLTETDVIAKLIDMGESYREVSTSHGRSSVELYTELFTQVLFPPTRVRDADDPYSFHVQIEALLDVLAVTNIWIDFGIVEWRVRLGQILWGAAHETEVGNDPSINVEVHDSGAPGTQKFWLLLQILLSCELLIRLDLVSKKVEHDANIITADAVRRFEEDAKQIIRWSLILARLWLDNICIEKTQSLVGVEEKKPTTGWLATLTGTATATSKEVDDEKFASAEFQGCHQACQISGLVHFAQKLQWPQVDKIAAKFSPSAAVITDSTLSSPTVGTPLPMTTQRSSYFGASGRPAIKRGLSRQEHRKVVPVQPSGWLSRSYLTGLVLPGEGLSHFLISTLLEVDESAVFLLSKEGNLYGGFIYSSKSYWSTACIVGRILAAGKGASECIGWLSSGVLPLAANDGWVSVEVGSAPDSGDDDPKTARIWKKHIIEREGHVLGNGDASTILPGDFTLPVDDIRGVENLEVTLESLELFAVDESANNSPRDEKPTALLETIDTTRNPAITNYSAKMTFAVKSLGGGCRNLAFNILYDVQFVTAHPCVPSHHTRILDSPASPSFRVPSPPPQVGDTKLGPHELYAGHPLHKSFVYKREVLSQVLDILPQSSISEPHPLASLHTTSQEIFVIDCDEPSPPSQPTMDSHISSIGSVARKHDWGSDLEMLARAWCAEKGYNALISRRGRNCIACSIREARALGWKIVLRFG